MSELSAGGGKMAANIAIRDALRKYGEGFGLWMIWRGDQCFLVCGGRLVTPAIGSASDDLGTIVLNAEEAARQVIAL